MKVLVTGAAGFICGYLVEELLEAGHEVTGLDNFSKYGRVTKSYDDHPSYRFVEGDAKDVALVTALAADVDQVVAAAAMIGGISYFHEFAYDLLAENERILAATFDAAIAAHRAGTLDRIVVLSSSMVFESTTVFPTPEGAERTSPPPISTYGFQKLSSEYFARGAWEQYQLPYTILRPFNCVGIGERRAVRDTDVMSGNVKLALVARRPRPRPQGASRARTRSTSWARATRSGTTRTAAISRRGSGSRWSRRCGGQRGLQSLDRGVHDGPGAGRDDLDEGQRRRHAVPLRHRPALRARRPAPRPRCRARHATSSGSRPRRACRRCSTRSIPWIREELEAGRL